MSDRRLFVNAAWNYSGTFAEGLVGLVLVTYIARHVSPAEYGLALFALTLAEVFMLFDFGLFGLLPRGYLAERARPDGRPMQLVGSALIATAALGLLACGVMIVVGLLVVAHGRTGLDPSVVPAARTTIMLTGILLAITLPTQTLLRVYEAENRFRSLSVLNVATAIARGAVTIVAVSGGYGARGIVVAALAAGVLRLVVLASPGFIRAAGMTPLELRWDWVRLRPTWRLGGWAFADNVAHHISFGIDTLVLGAFSSMHSVALYGVANKIPLHAGIAIEKAVAVALPAMAEQHVAGARSETARLFVVLTRFTFAAVLPVVVIGSVVATSLLVFWAGAEYAEASTTLRWLLGGTIGLALAVPCITALYAVNAVAEDAKIAIVEAILNLGATLALVPRFGAAGAASATAVTHLATTLFWLVPVTCARVELPVGQLAKHVVRGLTLPLVCSLGVLAVAWTITGANDHALRVAGGAVAGIVYFAVLWLRWRPRAVSGPVPS
jgi:O-antigen/teichoic acid export membrane protein